MKRSACSPSTRDQATTTGPLDRRRRPRRLADLASGAGPLSPRARTLDGDAGVRLRVAEALRRTRAAGETVIEVQAQEGVVRLSGVVSSPRARLELCATARAVAGVEAVENALRIR